MITDYELERSSRGCFNDFPKISLDRPKENTYETSRSGWPNSDPEYESWVSRKRSKNFYFYETVKFKLIEAFLGESDNCSGTHNFPTTVSYFKPDKST